MTQVAEVAREIRDMLAEIGLTTYPVTSGSKGLHLYIPLDKPISSPGATTLAKKAGLPVNFVSGGSTGTYNIDKDNGLTELEAGSYVFMDTAYFAVGGKDDDATYNDFKGALTILTTIDSKRHANIATIDYGNKAMLRPTDKVKGMPWIEVGSQGAEYGALKWKDGDRDLKLGERVEIYCTTLDMSTAVYDRYYVARGDQIVDVWPIMGRGGAAQR